jgi:Arc/MetJ-type ribon-helix-helix transcriptional regulator
MPDRQHVGVRLDNSIVDEIEQRDESKSEFIRTAVREKLGRPTPHSRVDSVERSIDDLQSQIREIRSALKTEAQASYDSYEPKAGNFLDDDGP